MAPLCRFCRVDVSINCHKSKVLNVYDFTADAFGVLIRFALRVVLHNLKLRTAGFDGS